MKDRAMRVPQECSRLRVVLMSGVVCRRSTPDRTGRYAEHEGNNGGGVMQAAVGVNNGVTAYTTNATDSVDATRERGEGYRRRKSGQKHDDTFGGRRDGGGQSGYTPTPEDLRLREFYGDWVHVNHGTHLDGGIRNNLAWLAWWRDLALMPLRRYEDNAHSACQSVDACCKCGPTST